MDRPVELTSARLVFRFAVGGTALAGEWLAEALRALEELPPPPSTVGSVEAAPPSGPAGVVGNVVVGAVSAALRWHPPTERLAAASRGAGAATRRGLRILSHAPGAGFVARHYHELRADVDAQLRRWAEEGAREALAGRRLARLASPSFFELVVGRLAQSPELRGVIEEQSAGVAASSVAELRDRSEVADRVVERVVERFARRLLRRRPKQAPPDVVRGAAR
jgi:hypothetical protein